MNIRNILGVLVACGAGYVGGVLASKNQVRASPPDAVRATRFELVDASGTPVASWEYESGSVHIRFPHKKDDTVGLDMGIFSDGRPFISMFGRDGRRRLVMGLDLADKPALAMGDEKWQGRVALGFMPPDTWPYSNWDHWGLVFRGFGSEHAIVGMGMTNTPKNPAEPFLTVSGKNVR